MVMLPGGGPEQFRKRQEFGETLGPVLLVPMLLAAAGLLIWGLA